MARSCTHLDTFAGESDDDFARAIRLLPVWSHAKQVIVSYGLLGRMPLPALPSNLKMAWSLRAAEPVTIFNCTCFAWESVENLFGSAEFAVRCTDPDTFVQASETVEPAYAAPSAFASDCGAAQSREREREREFSSAMWKFTQINGTSDTVCIATRSWVRRLAHSKIFAQTAK